MPSLTEKLAPYLDSHFVYELLRFDVESGSLSQEEAAPLIRHTLKNSNLVDVLKKYGVDTEEKDYKDLPDSVEKARALYQSGKYSEAAELLGTLRDSNSGQPAQVLALTWGKFAAEIMANNTSALAAEAELLQELVVPQQDENVLTQLNTRVWLLHWLLFAIFGDITNAEKLCDTFFHSQSMSAIQAVCPWLLRYLAVALLIVNGKRPRSSHYQRRLKEVTRAISQEQYEYTDEVLDLMVMLLVDYDISSAKKALGPALEVISKDYLLHSHQNAFHRAILYHLGEIYCRSHQTVSLDQLAELLSVSSDEARDIISPFVEDSRVDSSFDKDSNTYTFSPRRSDLSTLVDEKTRGLEQRAENLYSQVQRREA